MWTSGPLGSASALAISPLPAAPGAWYGESRRTGQPTTGPAVPPPRPGRPRSAARAGPPGPRRPGRPSPAPRRPARPRPKPRAAPAQPGRQLDEPDGGQQHVGHAERQPAPRPRLLVVVGHEPAGAVLGRGDRAAVGDARDQERHRHQEDGERPEQEPPGPVAPGGPPGQA